jgi:hypothetical protein
VTCLALPANTVLMLQAQAGMSLSCVELQGQLQRDLGPIRFTVGLIARHVFISAAKLVWSRHATSRKKTNQYNFSIQQNFACTAIAQSHQCIAFGHPPQRRSCVMGSSKACAALADLDLKGFCTESHRLAPRPPMGQREDSLCTGDAAGGSC